MERADRHYEIMLPVLEKAYNDSWPDGVPVQQIGQQAKKIRRGIENTLFRKDWTLSLLRKRIDTEFNEVELKAYLESVRRERFENSFARGIERVSRLKFVKTANGCNKMFL